MPVTPKAEGARTYHVRVTFSCHTFTREWDHADHPELRVPDDNGIRSFCPIRHGHSLNIRDCIEQAANGKVYFNNQTRFLISSTLPGLVGPYAIYFNVIQAKTTGLDVIMDVRSAYHKPNLATNLPRITFATIVGNIAAGKPIVRPKK
jgi:hypothetical protein